MGLRRAAHQAIPLPGGGLIPRFSRYFPFAAAVAFAAAHTQSPLYYSNQNQYFLHALAAAGEGNLSADWLANTTDPTPAFTFLAAAGYRACGGFAFQAAFFAALVGYFLALWKLVAALPVGPRTRSEEIGLAAGIIAVHAGILRYAADRLLGADYAWFLQCGVANQYLLGPGLQPSVAGVLLVAGLAAFARGKPVLGAALAASANLLHATYLLPSGLLVAGFLVAGPRRLPVATVALAVVAPVVGYHIWTFGPSDPATFAEAQRVLADVRIPHHARPARWFDWVAACQCGWMLLGILAVRRTRLFVPLAVAAGLAVVGTAIVIASGNPTAALTFPWRVSAVLVPVSTAVIFAKLVRLRAAWVVFLALGVFAVGAAPFVHVLGLGYREPAAEDPALAFVKATAKPGDVYLMPARFPKPAKVTGVYSNTFAPAPAPTAVVYFEMARFRLATGAVVYADFKAIPYRDAEVIEWHRRVATAEAWFAAPNWDATGAAAAAMNAGVTHVVAPAAAGLNSARLELLFEGGAYRVYRLR